MINEEIIIARDRALLSLDGPTIAAYMVRYGVPIPQDNEVFWASVHRARLTVVYYPEEAKAVSRAWLIEHGFEARGL